MRDDEARSPLPLTAKPSVSPATALDGLALAPACPFHSFFLASAQINANKILAMNGTDTHKHFHYEKNVFLI